MERQTVFSASHEEHNEKLRETSQSVNAVLHCCLNKNTSRMEPPV
jgi:hypothetical protein